MSRVPAPVRRLLRPLIEGGRRRARRAGARVTAARLRRRTASSEEPLVGNAEVVVSLTSHGSRVQDVALTIESIGRGRVRPSRLILWLDDQKLYDDLPAELRQQRERGLEVQLTQNYGPHTKYFPYVSSSSPHTVPMVTADDDILYPKYWLDRLLAAHAEEPGLVLCYRAAVVRLTDRGLAPYSSWPMCKDTVASRAHFATGVSGVMYPPAILDELSRRGESFRAATPWADDIWLHWVALQSGTAVRQIAARPRHFPVVPGSQGDGLVERNVRGDGNDSQIRALYTEADVELLRGADP